MLQGLLTGLIVTATWLSTQLAVASANGGDSFALQDKNGICLFSEEVTKYAAYVMTKLRNHETAVQQAYATEQKLSIYFQQHETDIGRKTGPILAAHTEKKPVDLATIKQIGAKAANAIATINHLAGRLTETMELLASIHRESGADSNEGCLTQADAKVHLGRSTLAKCGATHVTATTDATEELTTLTPTGFPKLRTARGSTKVAGATAQCRLLQTDATDGPIRGQITSNDMTLAAGYVKLNDNGADYTLVNLQNLKADNAASAPKAYKQAYLAFTAFKQATENLQTSYVPLTADDVTSSTQAIHTYKLLVKQMTEEEIAKATAETNQTIVQEMKALYGEGAAFTNNRLNKAADNEVDPISYGGSGTAKTSLKSETDAGHLRKIRVYYTMQRSAATAAAVASVQEQVDKLKKGNKAAAKVTETDKTCEKKGAGDKRTSPCTLVGESDSKKCKLDTEAAKQAKQSEDNDGNKEDKCSDKKKQKDCTESCKWNAKE
ncbi:Trypanosome variant surface glycoprotein (A-type), putative [Trypanosoma equiperdum]|uniref:Trypanosome variant surface glycoprotein (A-type), putative n=1 Tax=Trypanosoma equiperdum TaxID=5694 RepID=A0A1G4HY24_TRYEQ|nr:Trypanosome variant surface glycoprotein (A-type), putative [Trypanosoma equiperdum]